MRRRELLTGALGAFATAATGLAWPRRAAAQQPGLTALNPRLSLVTTGGTNVLALVTADGFVLVDSGTPEQSSALLASLTPLEREALAERAGERRVAKVFNTHYHLQNTGANEPLRQRGAAIIAHENTRIWMATPVWNPSKDRYSQPRPKAAHPTETFRTDGSMTVGGERIDYGYLLEAHTSGDIYVYFRTSNVLAVGDVASPVRDPELDYFTGAWIGGRADALAKLLKLCDASTTIVPGFGPVMTRADLQAERDLMKTIYDRAVDRIRQGDDAGDMLEAGVLKGLPRTWNDPRKFLYDVQKGLWAHHNKLNPNVV